MCGGTGPSPPVFDAFFINMYNSLATREKPIPEKRFLKAEMNDNARAISPSELKLLTGSYNSLSRDSSPTKSHFGSSPTKSGTQESLSCFSDVESSLHNASRSKSEERDHWSSLPDLTQLDLCGDQEKTENSVCNRCSKAAICCDHYLNKTSAPLDRRKSLPDRTGTGGSSFARNPMELKLSDNPGENRLSKVLESMPLVYIPHTKQLLSCDSSNQSLVLSKFSNHNRPSEGINNTTLSAVNNTSYTDSKSDSSSVTLSHDEQKAGATPADRGAVHETPELFQVDLDTIDQLENRRNSSHWPQSSTLRTDASSFSSLSSISTDYSLSTLGDEYLVPGSILDQDDTGFMDVPLHSRNTFDKSSTLSSQDSGIEDRCGPGVKTKRRGITFLARTLFSKKSTKDASKLTAITDVGTNSSAPGWKLFGKVPPKLAPHKDADQIQEEYQQQHQLDHPHQQQVKPCLVPGKSPSLSRKSDIEVASTTGLILEDRPTNLPPKPAEEAEQHKHEYEAIMEAARKKELKDAKRRRRQQQQQLRQEDQLSAAVKIWNADILPNWENTRHSKRARDLWWSGIPPSVRGKVWKLAIGNELNITSELYEICLDRAKDRLKILDQNHGGGSECEKETSNKESSVELIRLDVSRTFPQLCIFQKGGPYHELLHSLLGAYACYRPDVGYVQGMSFVAAVLLLNMDVDDAFICFANLLNRPCQVAFFRINENLMKAYFLTYEEFFNENLPKLYTHFKKQNLTPDLYIIDWMYSLFSRSLALDVASRVWDIFCRDGEEFLFRTALGILKMFEDILYNLDFIHLAQFLTRLPEDVNADRLFRSVDQIRMTVDKKRFVQVLSSIKETLDIG